MSKELGISTRRPGQAEIPRNAEDFIHGAAPAASPDLPLSSMPPLPPQGGLGRVGPEGGTRTVLKNGNQRITVSLEPDLYEAMRDRAFTERIDNTEVVRRALRKYLGR